MTDAEDAEAKKLLEQWDGGAGDGGDDVDVDDDDEEEGYDDILEKFRRDVTATDMSLDHILLGCSDLDAAVEEFNKMTGVEPLMVVSLNGCGTKSSRAAFNDCSFIEIVGPDAKQTDTALKLKLQALPPGKIVPLHYAIRNSESDELRKTTWKDMGLECDKVTMVARDRGMPWKWDMFLLGGHDEGGIIPFFIHWGDSHHAAGKLPIMGDLTSVKVSAPSSSPVHKLLSGISGVSVSEGSNNLEFTFTSPQGSHSFSTADPIGITFPDEGGLPVNSKKDED